MGISAMSHVAIGVRDMDRALEFYRDVLGLRVTADRVEEFAQGPGQSPARRRAVYLRWMDGPHSTYVVLDQHLAKETQGAATPLFDAGIHHFAFWVDDLDDTLQRARASGFEVVLGGGAAVGSEWLGEAPGGRPVRSAMLRDPEGNHVQLDQRV
jgi:catechol 2,3-dioxygenase-like lactoylglutathione lyase family enzyme